MYQKFLYRVRFALRYWNNRREIVARLVYIEEEFCRVNHEVNELLKVLADNGDSHVVMSKSRELLTARSPMPSDPASSVSAVE